jgi:leucyl aminopeptidase (aminopeptidase T)
MTSVSVDAPSTSQVEWTPDWDALANQIVNRTFKLQRGERVIYLADPYYTPELLDSVRSAVLAAGGIEQATLLNWTPRLAAQRTPRGTHTDAELARLEQSAHLELFNSADVFIWLPNDTFRTGAYSVWESEWILGRWRGRGLHFHWFPDAGAPAGDPIHRELEKIYQLGILDIDYEALADRQRRLVETIRGRRLRVTTPDGTDLQFDLPANGWYHCNDGDASREKALRAMCARDREEELPCGAVRTVPAAEHVDGIVSTRRVPPWNGFGLDLNTFGTELDLVFRDGHVAELRGGSRQAELDAARMRLMGDWDRLGEVVFGTNPLLVTPPATRLPTYWGFGDGVLRLHLGDNVESGGHFTGNLWINLWLTDCTVEVVGGETILRDGKLLVR